MRPIFCCLPLFIILTLAVRSVPAQSPASFVIVRGAAPDGSALGPAEKAAPEFLLSHLKANKGISDTWPDAQTPVIAIGSRGTISGWQVRPDAERLAKLEKLGPEGFILHLDKSTRKAPTIWIVGADSRGALFGAGKFLRLMRADDDGSYYPDTIDIAAAPAYPIRGHQLGYRNRANSWDAWTVAEFEQYIKELILFGTNAIEGIPFQDESTSPLMIVPRREMNKAFGEICAKYELEYWVWTPVEFDLNDTAKREAELIKHEEFYNDTPRLDGVFFPGGDPGANPAALVIPFLVDISKRLATTHPQAKVWLSLQWFGPEDQEKVYKWIEDEKPDWFGGLVCGPSSPSCKSTRARLDKKYKVRNYPDITHTIRCQHPVPDFDRAFALTLGREGINVRPVASKFLHNYYAPWTDGFISYTDGVHDDVNKIIWSAAGWDPDLDVRETLKEYARVFIDPDPEDSWAYADIMMALENNWRGAAKENGTPTTAAVGLAAMGEKESWRARMISFRAYYDWYQRERRLLEELSQDETDIFLKNAAGVGSSAAIESARKAVQPNYKSRGIQEIRKAVEAAAQALFDTIKLQTSVSKHHASEPERGCMLDFMDHPLNDRLYYEFMFEKIAALPTEEERVRELVALGSWRDPGPGGFYDDIGDVQNQPHVITGEGFLTDPDFRRHGIPEFTWANGGDDHRRVAWMDWQEIEGLRYDGLDPSADYTITVVMDPMVKATLKANGAEAPELPDPPTPPMPPAAGKFAGRVSLKAWSIPKGAITDGALELRWERTFPRRPEHKSQNQPAVRPALAEAWLRKAPLN